jgi:predicted metalloprotease with PDZ domain
MWLEVATIIHRETQGKKSIDDFCLAFHGGPNNGPEVKTYTFDQLVSALNGIAPYDWATFFQRAWIQPPRKRRRAELRMADGRWSSTTSR